MIFDWEPAIISAGELIGGRRGEDIRLRQRTRRTTDQRRAEYKDMMDSRAALRDQMEAERKAEAKAARTKPAKPAIDDEQHGDEEQA